jgi:GntR family transcriptional regulator of vanillate catabolism
MARAAKAVRAATVNATATPTIRATPATAAASAPAALVVAEPAADASPSPSQTVKAQLALRELILGGELTAGARIAELWLVERLGVSRTPVRLALVRLAEEGLLDALPSGGYAVKAFSESDIQDAIEVRGTLEGLAARLAAERGVSPVLVTEARECLERIDTALAQPALTDATFSVYVEENARFHALLSEMAGSALVARQLDRAMALPFASPNGFVMAHSVGPRARDVLVVAQEQHRMVIEAIVQREGARAEGLMREHARIARRNLQQALRSHQSLQLVPGGRLIRRRSER